MNELDERTIRDIFEFLDLVRGSGQANMFGLAPEIEGSFSLSRADSRKVLSLWMDTFSEEPVEVRAHAAFLKKG